MADIEHSYIAISYDDFRLYGCPHCGSAAYNMIMSGMGTTLCTCKGCIREFAILDPGQTRAKIGFFDQYPVLQDHPLKKTDV